MSSATTSEGIECLVETPICHKVTDTFSESILFQNTDENGIVTGLTDLSGVTGATWNIYNTDGDKLVTVNLASGISINLPTSVVSVVITPAELAVLVIGCHWWELIFDSSGVIQTQLNGPWESYLIFPPSSG